MAISAVAYLKATDMEQNSHVGFLMGKSKLAPHPPHTIPRLELCAAVLATEMADLITDKLDIDIHKITFYTDSRIVLGYIHNSSRRFYVYVANKVARIRRSTSPEQWHFVSTEHNPADHGTRSVPAAVLKDTNWLKGPAFLYKDTSSQTETFALIDPDADEDVRSQPVTAFTTNASESVLGSHRFERFSSWRTLSRAIAKLIQVKSSLKSTNSKTDALTQAKLVIIRNVQHVFAEECKCLSRGDVIPKSSPLRKLNPFVDADGLLRVGGRISLVDIPWEEKDPIIVPKKHHLSDRGSTWTFNPPHSSHMGGVWKRMIGVARRILDALLLKIKNLHLTHEVLVTLMSEVMAIMNARPLVPISSDPDMPTVLTPSMLLTQKIDPVLPPPGEHNLKDLYSKQWKQV
ncbi:hypothetical protein NFI96_009859 [Prochilodus magdalenae]|nr:hypothetical protein NFI96_009859 [Prochilodus magdalenae]